MDNNVNYNFGGYGDNYAAGTDHTSDPVSHYGGWGSQWVQPTSAAQQQVSAGYPQYVSQHQQQQQQQQQQPQAQNPYAHLSNISTFMQQQQQQKQAPFQNKKFGVQSGAPKAANRNAFGAFGGSSFTGQNALGMLGPEWVQPPSQSAIGAISRPSNKRGGDKAPFFPQQAKGNWKNKGKAPAPPRKFDAAGKTPAMVLHELFKNIGEEYEEVHSIPKRYRCTLTVEGKSFQMESANKKAAKQKCAEQVVRELRPDLHIVPFEEGFTSKAVPVKTEDGSGNGQAGKRPADSMLNQATEKKAASVKKPKLTPVESALSLLDLMQKIIAESETKYTPVFEAAEIPKIKTEPVNPEEQGEAKEEPSIVGNEKKGAWRKHDGNFTVTLKFAEQGKVYSKSGGNRGGLKDMCVREALRDLFNVSQADITTVARRHASNRLGSDMNIIQCLHVICSLLNCEVTLECEPAEDKPLGDGRMFFTGKCGIIDRNDNNAEFKTKSPSLHSKALAKEYAAQEMLRNYFQIDPVTCVKGDGASSQGPCAVLHAMLNKQIRQKTKIAYEFKDNVPPVAGQVNTIFYCDCVIDEKDRFTGTGRSKKLAKNDAAMIALKKIFKIDFDPTSTYPLALSSRAMTSAKVSENCRMVSEFCKREYYQMVEFFNVHPSNQIACFVLLNDVGAKRFMSCGSSVQYVAEPDSLSGANGTTLIHMDPMVLARRALIRNFLAELLVYEFLDEKESIFVKGPDGKAVLKPNMKLALYSNFSPVCTFAVDDASKKSLAYVTPTNVAPIPDEVMTLEEIKRTKRMLTHCTADKLLKWNTLGVQGALLSNVLQPIFISEIYFGSEIPVTDDSLKFAFQGRLGPNENEHDLIVESIPAQMNIRSSLVAQEWYRGLEGMETINLNSGRTEKGSPSKVCKAEIFEAYRKLKNIDHSIVDYAKAKESASEYQYEKKVFYGKLEVAGYGKWQTKPPALADSFTVADFD